MIFHLAVRSKKVQLHSCKCLCWWVDGCSYRLQGRIFWMGLPISLQLLAWRHLWQHYRTLWNWLCRWPVGNRLSTG